MKERYKFENFKDQRFPVYSAQKSGTGTLVVSHFHRAAELIHIIDGTVALYLHASRYICHAGDIVFIPPYTVHSMTSNDDHARIRGFVFELSMVQESAFGTPVAQILNKDAISDSIFTEDTDIAHELKYVLLQAFRTYDSSTPTYHLEMLSSVYRITALLISHFFHSNTDYENYGRIQPVIQYMNTHYKNSISLTELSTLLNVCDDHLIRLFKTVTNKTPMRYLSDLRLQEALKLLKDTDLSIIEIASRVGFSSVNYMSRVFRERLQLSPSQYRQRNRSQPLSES